MDIPKSPQNQLNRHIGDLPYDVLHVIFVLCWKAQNEEEGTHFPTIASHVCQTWRRYALATPTFWTVLEFRERRPPIGKYQNWLERSKDCPLDIVIHSTPFRRASVKHAKEIMRLTVPHIRRWRAISVHGLPDKILRLIFDRITQDGAEGLESLEMVKVVEENRDPWFRCSKSRRSPNWKFQPFSKGKVPPKLRHIILEGVSLQYFIGRFERLQALEVLDRFIYEPDSGVQSTHDILSALPDLHVLCVDDRRHARLSIETGHTQRIRASPVPLLTHKSLTQLSVQAPQATRNAIISSLVLPNLRYLLDRKRMEPTLGVCCLPHLSQHRPFPKLVSLRVGGSHSSRPLLSNSWNPPNANVTNMAHLEGALAGLSELRAVTFDHVDFEGSGG
ncbi:hypothetical protein FRC05_004533, partial [Tulasnella sp. 425]